MKIPLLSRYRVDEVPIPIRLQFYFYGYGVGLFLFFYILLSRLTSKVKVSGRENLKMNSNHIFCLWHSFVPLALICAIPHISGVLDRSPQVWMQHPFWYMKPIHVLIRLLGIKRIVLGSTGHSGRSAAEVLEGYLTHGYSTVLNPDGPNGPAFVLKKGILHLSLKSGVPVVPLQFSSSSFRELKTWDQKKIARPFSTIQMNIGKPIFVTNDNFEYCHDLIERKMSMSLP